MQWVAGIDGGGSKTVGWAADLTGRILGQAEKGPSNYHTVGLAQCKAVIAAIIEELTAGCKLDKQQLQVVSLGLAGADRRHDQQVIREALAGLQLPCRYLISSDAKIALAAGLGKTEGIVLIAGTGSIAYGINRQGTVIRAGGWGQLASDEGSGYDIGRQALVRAIRAAEGRDKATALLPGIMAALAVSGWDELIGQINAAAMSKTEVAALAPAVAAAADQGDEVACEILRQAGQELALLVQSVLARGFGGQRPVPVCAFGSIISNIPLLRQQLIARLPDQAALVCSQQPPVAGAVKLALVASRETY